MGLGLKLMVFSIILSFSFNIFAGLGVFECSVTSTEQQATQQTLEGEVINALTGNIAATGVALVGFIIKDSTLIFAGIITTLANYIAFPKALLNECASGDWGFYLSNLMSIMWLMSSLTFISKSDF
jgi:hypothetical protein